MRFFIALEITDQNRTQIRQIQQEVAQVLPEARLTNPEKLHLTLAFIGEQPDSLKERLVETLAKATRDIPPFEITPGYINGFPSLHHPNVLWIGVKGDIDRLIVIQQRLEDELTDLKLPVDTRPFMPHITIAKFNSPEISHKIEDQLREIMDRHLDPIYIDSIKLFESIPDSGLHSHNTLAEIRLTPNSQPE